MRSACSSALPPSRWVSCSPEQRARSPSPLRMSSLVFRPTCCAGAPISAPPNCAPRRKARKSGWPTRISIRRSALRGVSVASPTTSAVTICSGFPAHRPVLLGRPGIPMESVELWSDHQQRKAAGRDLAAISRRLSKHRPESAARGGERHLQFPIVARPSGLFAPQRRGRQLALCTSQRSNISKGLAISRRS